MPKPDLEEIKKHFRKTHKNWSDEEINRHALETLNQYILVNKDKLEKEEKLNKEEFEKALDMEFLNLYIDNKNKEKR